MGSVRNVIHPVYHRVPGASQQRAAHAVPCGADPGRPGAAGAAQHRPDPLEGVRDHPDPGLLPGVPHHPLRGDARGGRALRVRAPEPGHGGGGSARRVGGSSFVQACVLRSGGLGHGHRHPAASPASAPPPVPRRSARTAGLINPNPAPQGTGASSELGGARLFDRRPPSCSLFFTYCRN